MRLMYTLAASFLASGLELAAAASQPAAGLDLAAREAFNAGRYAVALPMLTQLAERYKDDAGKLGPIQEQIRVCQAQIAANVGAAPAPTTGPSVEMSADTRKPHVKPAAGETAAMAIQELGNFDYDPDKGGNIPADVVALSGSKLRLHGYMIPMDQADRITQFALVPSLFACCFGQPPQIQHTIVVSCPPGKSISYFPDEISVEGSLNVQEKKEDGFIVSIFEMTASSVKPMAK